MLRPLKTLMDHVCFLNPRETGDSSCWYKTIQYCTLHVLETFFWFAGITIGKIRGESWNRGTHCNVYAVSNPCGIFWSFSLLSLVVSCLCSLCSLCQGAKSDHQTLQQKVDAAENTARLEASRREILEAEKTRLTQAANGYESAWERLAKGPVVRVHVGRLRSAKISKVMWCVSLPWPGIWGFEGCQKLRQDQNIIEANAARKWRSANDAALHMCVAVCCTCVGCVRCVAVSQMCRRVQNTTAGHCERPNSCKVRDRRESSWKHVWIWTYSKEV